MSIQIQPAVIRHHNVIIIAVMCQFFCVRKYTIEDGIICSLQLH